MIQSAKANCIETDDISCMGAFIGIFFLKLTKRCKNTATMFGPRASYIELFDISDLKIALPSVFIP